eukprot:1156168-Pelagomonas_calceolata.AAC.7
MGTVARSTKAKSMVTCKMRLFILYQSMHPLIKGVVLMRSVPFHPEFCSSRSVPFAVIITDDPNFIVKASPRLHCNAPQLIKEQETKWPEVLPQALLKSHEAWGQWQ